MKPKPKPGRPAYEADEKTRAQVKMLAAMGIPDYDIAKVIGLSGPTMRKYYMAELETGHIEANAQVAQSLFKQATNKEKPNVSAAIFWLKCRAEWRETTAVELTGKDGGPMETVNRIELVGMDGDGED